MQLEGLRAFYGDAEQVKGIDLEFRANEVTAIIGPSGCGKSTMIRCINRMHEEIPGARAEGRVLLEGADVYDPSVDVVAVRRAIGMVFQKPNPFPTMSIFDNVAAGLRLTGRRRGEPATARSRRRCAARACGTRSPTASAEPGLGLSGGQQQRLCIARSLAVDPEVLLMDEPCSALDPIATLKIEELIDELKQRVTIVIVTHNMQQAARVADRTAFMLDGRARRGRPDAGRSSPNPPIPEPRNMSPASSASARGPAGARAASAHAPVAGPGRASTAGSHFQEQLQRARDSTRSAGLDLVVEQLDRVLEALDHQDVELAQMVIADDDRVDGRYLEVHQGILSLLALQAPGRRRPAPGGGAAAHDQAHRAHGRPVREHRQADPAVRPRAAGPRRACSSTLAGWAPSPARRSSSRKAAFAGRDVGLAEDLVRQDREINRLNREIFRLAIEIGDDPDTREWAMHMILVARALERIGDNAVDIGEQVAFVVTGLFREFSDSSRRGAPDR